MATGSLSVFGAMVFKTSPASPWRASFANVGQSLCGIQPPSKGSSSRSSRSPPAARKSSTPCLEPSGAGGMRTMLTDIAHPPLQRLGQGVLGEAHLVVGQGVRVEGDHDLPLHEGDLIPVEEHLAVLLPVPDAQQGHGALAAADEGVRL